MSGDDFVAQEFEPRAVYLTDKETGATVFYQASLNQLFATRGLGKSIVTNALLKCLIGGSDFLRLISDGGLNVLLVDGELPSVQLQERLKQFGETGQLTILSPYLMSDPKELPSCSQQKSSSAVALTRFAQRRRAATAVEVSLKNPVKSVVLGHYWVTIRMGMSKSAPGRRTNHGSCKSRA